MVNKNGEVARVTKQRALLAAVTTAAINGRIGQQRLIVQLYSALGGTAEDDTITAEELQQVDGALLLELGKIGLSFDGGPHDT